MPIVRVSEQAALAVYPSVGRGDEKKSDALAVEAMRKELNTLNIDGTVVIGEGERDEAPMLYIGEKVGKGGAKIDIALDPLEGTTIAATGNSGSLAVIAFAEESGFLHAPDVYMNKIAVGPGFPLGTVDIDASPQENILNLAKAKGVSPAMITVCILDRPRHQELIASVRSTGAKVFLIGDGDVAGVIFASMADSPIDIYMGTGGAPEGVLAAAALQCIGGFMQGRLLFRNDAELARGQKAGISDFNRKYSLNDLAHGDILFSATGMTSGNLVLGVKEAAGGMFTQTLVMRSKTGTIRKVDTIHNVKCEV